jgi:hypothetical protein
MLATELDPIARERTRLLMTSLSCNLPGFAHMAWGNYPWDSGMLNEISIGMSRVRFEPPDTVLEVLVGDLSGPEMARILDASAPWVETGQDIYFLVDLSKVGAFSADAREAVRKRRKQPNIRGAVMFGASFHMRVVATIVHRALMLLDKATYGVHFADTEEQARARIEALRRERAQGGNLRG